MIYKLDRGNTFKRSFKKRKLTNDEESNYIEILYKLLKNEELPTRYNDHQLKGNFREYRECHNNHRVYRVELDAYHASVLLYQQNIVNSPVELGVYADGDYYEEAVELLSTAFDCDLDEAIREVESWH